MIRTLRYLLLFVFTGLSATSFAQGISGRVLDDKKEPLPSAVVQVFNSGGIAVGGNVTDYDGNYLIKPLDPGYYNVLVRYTGYDSVMITGVVVTPGTITSAQNFIMKKPSGKELHVFEVKEFKKKLVNVDNPGSRIMDATDIAKVPTNEVTDLVGITGGSYQAKRGSDVNMGGARTSGTQYIIDGVMVQGTVGINMSQSSVEQLEVITSGIPANYGDVSGGVVNITTRGAAPKFTGDIHLQHSIDGYNNNLVNFSIAGPIFKKKVPGDSTHAATKKPVLGFSLSGDYYDDHDRYPDYDQQYVIKGSSLNTLLQNPLHVGTDNGGNRILNYASNYISTDDLSRVKVVPNNVTQEARVNGKIDYQVAENMHIAAGGTYDYLKQDLYSRYTNLFAAAGTPVENTSTGRGFIRFTQKFGKAGDTTHSIISNAYYSVQADYQRLTQETEDPNFKKNIFDYAYNGKFVETRAPIYFTNQTDSTSGKTGTVLFGSQSTGISYTPSNLNPNLSNYTKQLFNTFGSTPLTTMQEIQFYQGLANGDEPGATYSYNGVGLFASPGTTQNYYLNFNSSQYALTVDASFDLQIGKTKHAIGFGLYYQQRIERQFYMYGNAGGPNSLWSLMRGLVSSVDNGNLKLDKTHPIFVVNGVDYTYSKDPTTGKVTYTDPSGNVKNIIPGTNDTIIYNYQNIGNSTFDQNLRKKLGISSTQDINIDALAPSTFNLGMFSADELLAGGNPYVGYYGYSYTGGAQSGTVNFNDYWTKKDANGNYTRPIGAFSPNYIAGYLMDNFIYKDIHFNIGVRVERYSANTKVLIDPYSLYPETTIGQVSGAGNTLNGGTHPSNLGAGTVVYVDNNNSSSPTIIGYRSGNNWYDPTGKYIEDPSILKSYSGGRDPEPLIQTAYKSVKITDTNFNPNLSFTDYNPAVTVMPRLSFSFPISDVADFYAHYDIYSQRPYPTSLGIATPYDYYYLQEHALQGTTVGNPNLRPQQTYDYEVGFQQKVSRSSALTITGFYKERKNMISVQSYFDAYPTSYYTYGNRDFSTTKGSTILYDLRATNHLTMTLSYTLQFAEGTGSSPTSGKGLLGSLIDAGLPNLRYITALDYDSRHNIVGNIDYRFKYGEGPMINGHHILQNAGIDLIVKARSGEPYTAYSDPLGNTIIGGVNGSRLPWHFGSDLRVDKNFALNFGKNKKDAPAGVKVKRPLYLKAILSVNNLLNTRDIIGVYGYTGKPDDNGYLTSSFGKQFVPQQINPATYSALYSIYINDPTHLNYARTINFALEFNF